MEQEDRTSKRVVGTQGSGGGVVGGEDEIRQAEKSSDSEKERDPAFPQGRASDAGNIPCSVPIGCAQEQH